MWTTAIDLSSLIMRPLVQARTLAFAAGAPHRGGLTTRSTIRDDDVSVLFPCSASWLRPKPDTRGG